MRARVALLAAAMSGASLLSWQAASTAEIVAAHYPDWLQELSGVPESELVKHQCAAVFDAHPDGQPSTIIAAYTDGAAAALRVLRASAGGVTLLDEPRDLDLLGSRCELELIDVDGDGRREVHLQLFTNMSTAHWLLEWDGQRLTNLTPVAPAPATGEPRTLLFNGEFIDLDLDGRMEFYGGAPTRIPEGALPPPARIWQLAGGGFADGAPVIAALVFSRDRGEPRTERVAFSLPAGALGPFTLEVRNGGASGDAAVSSAEIAVNGVPVVRPDDFRPSARLIERSVTLVSDNELAVRLAGAPGGRISVIVRSAAWAR